MEVWELQKDFKLESEPSCLMWGIDFVTFFVFFRVFVLRFILHGGARQVDQSCCNTANQNTRCHTHIIRL